MADTLSPEEISALMSALQEGSVPAAQMQADGPVVAYDLTSQDRIIRGQMPTLDAINEQVASMLASGLSGRTRLALRVTSSPAALFKFIDFGSALVAPSVICVLGLGSGFGHALLVLEPGLAEALLAAALGDRRNRGDGAGNAEARRELTAVEQLVLRRLLSNMTEAMQTAWAPVLQFHPTVVRFEPDPRMANIAPPTDVVIVSTFMVSGGVSGRLQLVIPYAAVESAKARLSSPPRMDTGSDARFVQALAHELHEVLLEVRGILGTTTLSFSRLLDLKVGDVLHLGTDEHSPVQVLIEGRPKLEGSPCVQHGSMSIGLTSGIKPPTAPEA